MRSLRARLLASHLAVALVGVVALAVVTALVSTGLVRRRLSGMHAMMRDDEASQVVSSVLPAALAWGAVAALAAAAVAGVLMARRVAEALAGIQAASRGIAAGDYSLRVPPQRDAELAAVAADIDALAARLEQSEARRIRLIDEVAHEMRTPLTTIRGTMEALTDEVVEPSAEVYERVAAEASRLQRLAEDLSTLSRADERALTLGLEDADVGTAVEAAAARLSPQFAHKGVTLETHVAGPLPARLDPDRIQQVLVNILGNALVHTEEGGSVTVIARRAAGPAGRATAEVEIADTGRGIAAEDLERVFERFFRARADGAPAGRGIGLTIARSLARAHGGDLTARSDGPGTGASFLLTLPTMET